MTDVLGIPVYEDDFVMFAYPIHNTAAQLIPAIVTESTSDNLSAIFIDAAQVAVTKKLTKEMFVRVSRFDIPKAIRKRLLDETDVLY